MAPRNVSPAFLSFEVFGGVGIVRGMSLLKAHPQLAALNLPVTSLRGVGTERAEQLTRLEIRSIAELLLHKPRRYEDRRRVSRIADLDLAEARTVAGKVVAMGTKRYSQGNKSVFEIILDDGSARLHCRWWNLPFMQKYFAQGNEVLVFGKLHSLRPREVDHPETEIIEGGEESSIHLNRVAPIYPLTEGLPQRWLRGLIWRTLNEFATKITDPWPELAREGFPSAEAALRSLHFPEEPGDGEKARARFAFEEFLTLQLDIQERRWRLRQREAHSCRGDNRFVKQFLAKLGFRLTQAQTRVLKEIRHDLEAGEPMRRLLQGDVGSGKTVVAACALLMTLESGYNGVLMAPTEILASQHFENFSRWLAPLGVQLRLRTGSGKRSHGGSGEELEATPMSGSASSNSSAPGSQSDEIQTSSKRPDAECGQSLLPSAATRPDERAASNPTIHIGTHALIEDSFEMDRLGIVIIDEQHKFGVAQRERLLRKGKCPHLLVMTATPIPRTLGLTLYGDLDVSMIDELPAGRCPIRTFVRQSDRLPKVWEFIRAKLKEGRQVYVVYPRVEEGVSGRPAKAVTAEFEKIQKHLAPFASGLLHGRMKPADKENVMAGFRSGAIQVLVATSLIEVGVDVPNATVMLVENAEQFGLAQLHQMRGRIGRGSHESFCILVADARTDDAQRRLKTLEETADGFKIAEVDLTLRGTGDLTGQQQSGLPPLRFGDFSRDLPLVEKARVFAAEIICRRMKLSAQTIQTSEAPAE
ncbi:MAG: ATP-dependent DNA helicase RecG [Pedosphaera sp.]|nr:ATP-dependent DNA helicase RecG [Pedosphaera sp.]